MFDSTPQAIEREHPTVEARFHAMLRHWVRRASPPPSWSALIRALQSPVMDQGGIAEEIKKMPVSVCVLFCKQLPSNQSFDKQISSHQKGGGVSRWGEWVEKGNCLQAQNMHLIWGPLDHDLVDPIKVHIKIQ